MANRALPFSPKSASQLEIGDLIGIPGNAGDWTVLQVSALRRTGPGARTTFGVGVLPWRGNQRPTAEAIVGLEFVEHGVTAIEIFTEGGAEVVAAAALAGGPRSNVLDMGIGVTHKLWGWRTAMERARSAADSAYDG